MVQKFKNLNIRKGRLFGTKMTVNFVLEISISLDNFVCAILSPADLDTIFLGLDWESSCFHSWFTNLSYYRYIGLSHTDFGLARAYFILGRTDFGCTDFGRTDFGLGRTVFGLGRTVFGLGCTDIGRTDFSLIQTEYVPPYSRG